MATGSHLAVNLQELEMLKREMPQQMPGGVQRSTSLDSMPPPAQPAPMANNSATDRLQQPQQSLAGIPELHNSLSSPPQACPVQRSRSLPLLDASQEIPAEILAQLTERENEQLMVTDVRQHSLQQQQQQQEAQEPQPAPQQTHQQHNINNRISDSSSTCNSISISNVISNSSNMNNVPFSDYVQASQYRILTQSQLQQATHLQENSQPLNLSQTAEVRQILSQGLPSHIPRVANFAGRQVQVGRDDLPLDWPSFQQAARYSIRPSEPRLGFAPSMLPPAIGQMPPSFNPAFPGRGIDSYGVGTSADGIRYSMPGAMNPTLQKPHMPLSVFARQHPFIKEEVGRHSPKDVTRVLQVPMDHVENNNDKSSPNIQAMSDGSTSNIAEKNMMPLSVSVSVAFSEPSQDSPSFSQQSNSPALLKPAADQTLSMINYHEDHLLSDTGLMSNSPVPSTLDENFLNSNMIISTNSAARLSDATNLTGLDSNPPSVKMEGFDLFEGSGDVDEQNYITDSISPQSLSMEDSNQGLPHGIQPGHGNPRPLSQTGISAAHSRGLDVAGPPQPGNNNGPLGDTPAVASQPRSRKGRPKVTGAPGHRYQQPCPTCGKVFGSSSALAKHKLIHSNERRHKCILCAKSFKRQDHLTGHMLTHRSKKPYECAVDNCGKSYCDIRSLRRHFESQHPGLVMEDNMNYTGDEKDPELMAAEAAAVQANRHNQVMMRASPGADFALGLANPPDLNQSGSSQDTNDSPGSSSSAALQSLALAAQRVQNTPDPPLSQGQLSQDMSTIYRLDSYTSQMFGGNLPSMSQSVLTGGVSGGMTTSLPGGGPRELSIQVPNPKFQGLSLSSGGVGLSGNGMLSHQSPGSNRFSNQSGPDMGISPKSSSNKSHRSHEKERITVECTVCKRTFKSMPALNGHMRLHGGYNNARAEVTPKVSPSKSEEKPPLPTALTHSQSRSLAHPSNMNPTMNAHTQLSQAQSSQAMGQHRPPLRMVGQSATPPTTMHLSSVYTNTTTSYVPSWPEYRHPRPHTVMSGGKPALLPNLPNLPLNMLQDELTTLAHTAVGLAAQSQALQKPPVQISQPHHQPPQHHPLHHTTSLPMDRIQPVHPFNSRLPIGSKPLQMHNNQVSQIIPKEEPMPYPPPTSMGSPSPPKLESMYRSAQEQQIRSAEMPPMGHTTPPTLESKDENRSRDNVFRDPPPVLVTVTKKKPRPPSLFIPSWASNVTPGGIAPSTYPSQMRSPREIGVLYRSNSSTTPPPYTPPPMLSPIRSGSGLYFSVGSGSMPATAAAAAVTPKSAFPPSTPSMLQMHRRGSISASTEDSDFAFPSEPHINVGCDYQAAVPELVKNKEEVLEAPDWREGKLVWDPAIEQAYSEGELTSFLKLATTPGLPAGARNIEYAHHCLYRAKGDIEMALLMLLNGNAMVPDEHVHMADYKYDFSQEWTVAERKLYRDMYKAKGKDFYEIAKGIPSKTVRDCVEYYYWWKKLYPYNHDMQKYCHHSGANPTEENRKNECDLYPGETFLDYVPLKEYRHDKYYRGGPSNPKNNNTVKPSSTNQEDKPAAQQGQFVCNYPHCDASFKSRQALNGHIRVHGGSYKPNAATSNAHTNNQSRTTTSSSASSTTSSYRGGGGVGQNTKQMPPESSSDEMSNEEEDDDEDEEESDEGSSRELTENEHDDEEDGMTSDDDQEARFSCKICHKTFEKIKSRNAHMKSHHAADKKVEMGYGGGKEQQMFNHYMGRDSRSCSSSEEEEDEEEEDEEDMEGDDDGLEDDEEMMSSEEEEDDDMSS